MSGNSDSSETISFARQGRAGVVTLNRPAALNALSHAMVGALWQALHEWERDDSVERVVVRAKGRAFSAGGDLVEIYRRGRAGNPFVEFFADEYRLNAYIARYPKPYIALIDGIVMGGGVGISIHGSHRIFSENAIFAMPECGIGFFPDVGGSAILSRLDGGFGLYLGLTGARIRGADALACGIATQLVESARMDDLLADLAQADDLPAIIGHYHQPEAATLSPGDRQMIARCFCGEDPAQILNELESCTDKANEIAAAACKSLTRASPTSLHVACRQLARGRGLNMEECMVMEYRIVNRMLTGHDFYEGIRAAVIDRDKTPRWSPGEMQAVHADAIDRYFEPPARGDLALS